MTLRNVPTQQRSLKRLNSIVEAAKIVYEREGRDKFNTADVAEMAGCAIGTIYRYFDDRVGLIDYIDPHRDDAKEKLEKVREILTQPLPMVTASREQDRKKIMDAAVALIDG